MKPTTGLRVAPVLCCARYAAPSSSALPPISPIMMMPGSAQHTGRWSETRTDTPTPTHAQTYIRKYTCTYACTCICTYITHIHTYIHYIHTSPTYTAVRALAFGLRVLEEARQDVDEVGAVKGVAADAHARRLAQAHGRGLVDRLVREGARARHDACRVRARMMGGHIQRRRRSRTHRSCRACGCSQA